MCVLNTRSTRVAITQTAWQIDCATCVNRNVVLSLTHFDNWQLSTCLLLQPPPTTLSSFFHSHSPSLPLSLFHSFSLSFNLSLSSNLSFSFFHSLSLSLSPSLSLLEGWNKKCKLHVFPFLAVESKTSLEQRGAMRIRGGERYLYFTSEKKFKMYYRKPTWQKTYMRVLCHPLIWSVALHILGYGI